MLPVYNHRNKPVTGQPYSAQIAAHRGSVSEAAPENSLEAYQGAIDSGCEWIELDVQRTADGQLVCVHDLEIGDHNVEDLEYSALLSLGETHGLDIPTLEMVAQRFGNAIKLDVELKVSGYEIQAVETLTRSCATDRFVITSFLDETVKTIKSTYPHIRAGLILGVAHPRSVISTRLSELFPTRRLIDCQADFVAPNVRLIRFGFLWRMQRRGWPVWPWVVNHPSALSQLLFSEAVEVAITDHVKLALKVRQKGQGDTSM